MGWGRECDLLSSSAIYCVLWQGCNTIGGPLPPGADLGLEVGFDLVNLCQSERHYLRLERRLNSLYPSDDPGRRPARPDLGERWPARLVAASAENSLAAHEESRLIVLKSGGSSLKHHHDAI
jgi:hypothetical protein